MYLVCITYVSRYLFNVFFIPIIGINYLFVFYTFMHFIDYFYIFSRLIMCRIRLVKISFSDPPTQNEIRPAFQRITSFANGPSFKIGHLNRISSPTLSSPVSSFWRKIISNIISLINYSAFLYQDFWINCANNNYYYQLL